MCTKHMAFMLPVWIQQTAQDQSHQNWTLVISNFRPYLSPRPATSANSVETFDL